ncbi:reverse transcriptase domain-containing protein [Tanacetum coccineum]|uniref:Reverse transcriptase domain-containing protein n=1 Tax=Tanacetum coccineum TaxID=301880 RepID=A0ABQ5HZK0_9ASTR
MARAYSAGPSEKKEYAGTLPLCNKCNISTIIGAMHCKPQQSEALVGKIKGTLTCFECGNQGHYKSDCPEIKNQNHRNQAGCSEARGRAYALGGGETD